MGLAALLKTGPVTIDTPLEPGRLLIRSMIGQESLSRPFSYDLELVGYAEQVAAADMLGQPVTVHLERASGYSLRHFHGLVIRFEVTGTSGRCTLYHARIRPWLWLLTRASTCRIFQDESIPDIIKEVFRGHGQTDFEERLTGEYGTKEYIVQYGESDFHFVSRLMEREGIYYFFQHDVAKHTLVLADGPSAHDRAPECGSLPCHPPDRHGRRDEHVSRFEAMQDLEPGCFATMDYDFKRPNAQMDWRTAAPLQATATGLEVFEYPGGYEAPQAREACARLRLSQVQAPHARVLGRTNARGLLVGSILELTDHPCSDANTEYLVASATYEIHAPRQRSSIAPGVGVYGCDFEALPRSVAYRPPRYTPRPYIRGPQTARVTGRKQDEIYTDEHGRVKVRFFWDRSDSPDERSSCWLRVSQAWAGSGWGSMHIPRVGQEVLVDFLEGDPDRPIVVGRVYNGDLKEPHELPAHATRSGVKSRSSLKGAAHNFNEIRFEDAKDQEELFVQAERNNTVTVKKDQSLSVGGSRTLSVGVDESESITGSRTVHVEGNQSTTIDGQGKGEFQSTFEVTGKHQLHASDLIDVDAPTHIKLECGGSTILIEPTKITLGAGGGASVVLTADVTAVAKGEGAVVITPDVGTGSKNGGVIQIDANIQAASVDKSALVLDDKVAFVSENQSKIHAATIALKGGQQTAIMVAKTGVDLAGAGATVAGGRASLLGGIVEISGAEVKIN